MILVDSGWVSRVVGFWENDCPILWSHHRNFALAQTIWGIKGGNKTCIARSSGGHSLTWKIAQFCRSRNCAKLGMNLQQHQQASHPCPSARLLASQSATTFSWLQHQQRPWLKSECADGSVTFNCPSRFNSISRRSCAKDMRSYIRRLKRGQSKSIWSCGWY